MGRRRIIIKRMDNVRERHVTFIKRRAGLIKKAMELCILAGCDISLMIFSEENELTEFCSSTPEQILQRYSSLASRPHQTLSIKDYTDYVREDEDAPIPDVFRPSASCNRRVQHPTEPHQSGWQPSKSTPPADIDDSERSLPAAKLDALPATVPMLPTPSRGPGATAAAPEVLQAIQHQLQAYQRVLAASTDENGLDLNPLVAKGLPSAVPAPGLPSPKPGTPSPLQHLANVLAQLQNAGSLNGVLPLANPAIPAVMPGSATIATGSVSATSPSTSTPSSHSSDGFSTNNHTAGDLGAEYSNPDYANDMQLKLEAKGPSGIAGKKRKGVVANESLEHHGQQQPQLQHPSLPPLAAKKRKSGPAMDLSIDIPQTRRSVAEKVGQKLYNTKGETLEGSNGDADICSENIELDGDEFATPNPPNHKNGGNDKDRNGLGTFSKGMTAASPPGHAASPPAFSGPGVFSFPDSAPNWPAIPTPPSLTCQGLLLRGGIFSDAQASPIGIPDSSGHTK